MGTFGRDTRTRKHSVIFFITHSISEQVLAMSIEMQKGDPLNQTTCSTHSKESACPGCCACMNLFIFACCFVVVFALDATLFNGELMYQLRLLFLSVGSANCGWSMSFKDKSDVCVEIPPKIVDERRRYLLSLIHI